MKFLFQLILVLSGFWSVSIQAGPLDDLRKFIAPEGAMSNVTAPKAFYDQASGGVLGGGGAMVRGPAPKQLTPVQYQSGNLNSDPCTGSFDFRFPLFKTASFSEYKDYFNGVISATPRYLLEAAMDAYSPMLLKNFRAIDEQLQKLNHFSFNSCQTAQTIAGGVKWAVNNRAQLTCAFKKLPSGNNMVNNMEECRKNVNNEQVKHEEKQKDKVNNSMLEAPYNLVFESIRAKKAALTAADFEYVELMMSIVGTLLVTKSDKDGLKIDGKPSLFSTEGELAKLTGVGGEIKMYRCLDKKDCMTLTQEAFTLTEANNLLLTVRTAVENLIVGLRADDEPALNSATIALIENAQMPLLRLVEQDMILKGPGHAQNFTALNPELVELLCYEVVTSFVGQIVQTATEYVENASLGSDEPENIKAWLVNVRNLQKQIVVWRGNSYQKALLAMQIKESTMQRELVVGSNFQKLLNNTKK